MIILYTSPGCASCRKAKQWLKDNDMKYIEKNIFTTLLKEDEIKYLLQRMVQRISYPRVPRRFRSCIEIWMISLSRSWWI